MSDGQARPKYAQMDLIDGTVLPCCPSCGEVLPELENQKLYIENLEKELRVKRSRITRLMAEIAGSNQSNPHWNDARTLYGYWKQLLAPRSRSFGADCQKKVLACFKDGWTLEELQRAVDGYHSRQYVVKGKRSHTGQRDERFVELELICRDDKHVRQGLEAWERDKDKDVQLLHRGHADQDAALCDCGHARASHVPPWVFGKFVDLAVVPPAVLHEPCGVQECACVGFDTIDRQMQEWQERQRSGARRAA